jgi:hypothetical protein
MTVQFSYIIKINNITKLDRHESLGDGYIGLDAIKYISKFFFNINVPIILETRQDKIKEELKLLLDLSVK